MTGTIVPLDTIILPKVVVKNLSPNSLIFPVSVLIGADYTDESLINLPSGSSDTIEFTPYTVNFPGTIQAIFRISSNEDNCDETDELMANLTVQSGEGPVITDNTPKRGGNTGSVTLKITGNHFRPGNSRYAHQWSRFRTNCTLCRFSKSKITLRFL
ncbi:MAG: hypothetical protein IPJ06_19435 [Saprospiraceae bacterium]|nr:hypothetical protein [Saprospiraceae bacterium]